MSSPREPSVKAEAEWGKNQNLNVLLGQTSFERSHHAENRYATFTVVSRLVTELRSSKELSVNEHGVDKFLIYQYFDVGLGLSFLTISTIQRL